MNFFNKLVTMTTSVNTSVTVTNIDNIVAIVNNVIAAAMGLLTAGIIVYAIFIAYKFFTADDDGKRKNAKAQLVYAIIGIVICIAIMIAAPQITNAIKNTLGK